MRKDSIGDYIGIVFITFIIGLGTILSIVGIYYVIHFIGINLGLFSGPYLSFDYWNREINTLHRIFLITVAGIPGIVFWFKRDEKKSILRNKRRKEYEERIKKEEKFLKYKRFYEREKKKTKKLRKRKKYK